MKKRKRVFKQRDKYMIPVDGKLYETTEEVYRIYYKMERRERYLEERDIKKGVVNFSSLDNGNYNSEERITDRVVDIEKEVINKVKIEAVLEAIKLLMKRNNG